MYDAQMKSHEVRWLFAFCQCESSLTLIPTRTKIIWAMCQGVNRKHTSDMVRGSGVLHNARLAPVSSVRTPSSVYSRLAEKSLG